MASLPDSSQPDAPVSPPGLTAPSLWLYTVIILVAVVLVALAFWIGKKADWPGLFLNLAAGLIGSVVVIVFIDRRLRESELQAIRAIPRHAVMSLTAMVSPTYRTSIRFAEQTIAASAPLLAHTIVRPSLVPLEQHLTAGFVLLGAGGLGKTTWMQQMSVQFSTRFLSGEKNAALVVLLPLRQWLPDRSLSEAVIEHIVVRTGCSSSLATKLLRRGHRIVLLDGLDELWGQDFRFEQQFALFRKQYPNVAITVSARSSLPTPDIGLKVVEIPAPTAAEIEQIVRKRT
jgi:uncharacterized membrane protein YeaQ/YmgE (transglycosylase-associated protein family)